MAKIYTSAQINDSATLVFPAAEAIEDVRNKVVVVTADGAKVATGATAPYMGVGLITNDFPIAKGGDVHIQIKEIGLVGVGAEVTAGADVSAGADGLVKPAADGEYVLGVALSNGAVGDKIYIQINKYKG
ncbi:MAG: hypothetical protein IIV02_06040 [Peptococcaceae bacterium]|nr:hypothetical protein [Peptococcaceae bacterium]